MHEEKDFRKTGIQFYGEEFKYLGFYSKENGTYPILQHSDEVSKFIEKARENNSKCLMHCMTGEVLIEVVVERKHITWFLRVLDQYQLFNMFITPEVCYCPM